MIKKDVLPSSASTSTPTKLEDEMVIFSINPSYMWLLRTDMWLLHSDMWLLRTDMWLLHHPIKYDNDLLGETDN